MPAKNLSRMPRGAFKDLTDEQFAQEHEERGPAEMAKRYKVNIRSVQKFRLTVETRLGRKIYSPRPIGPQMAERTNVEAPGRLSTKIKNGQAIVFSDAHYWPGDPTPAHRTLVHFCKTLKPRIIVANGDITDGATIGRHAPLGWEDNPSLADEMDAQKDRMKEIEESCNAQRFWPLGNHDARFEARLATHASEYARVHGVHLRDHFPRWTPCYSLWVNEDVVIKHRWKGGVHASYNNPLQSGKTMVTGHTHKLHVRPYTDYSGTRYGVETGTLAMAFGPQFEYAEDNPRDHRSGFAVLTWKDGILLWPETVFVRDEDYYEFRGVLCRVPKL